MSLMSRSTHLRYSYHWNRKQLGSNLLSQSHKLKTLLLVLGREERVVAGQRLDQVHVKGVAKVREEVNSMAHRLIHRNKKGRRRCEETHLRTTIIARAPQQMQWPMVVALGRVMTKLHLQSRRFQGNTTRGRGRGQVGDTGTKRGMDQEIGA